METYWIVLIAIALFLLFIFLYWKFSHRYLIKKYGTKNWKHWPNKLSYWQGAILYSLGFTMLTLFILKWVNVLSF